jgi:prophage tail gpP-like protein
MSDDDLSLIIGNTAWQGWESVRVTRSVERMPADFQLTVTERFPVNAAEIDIRPFQACMVKIGGEAVITGYIDKYGARVSADRHSIQVSGRSKSQDLVDCSAFLPQMAVKNVDAVTLGNQLGQDYGITFSTLGTVPSQVLPQFSVTFSETPYQIMERVARYQQLLLYDGTDGNVILAQAGATTAASGIVQGVNTEDYGVDFSGDQRFSEYVAAVVSSAFLSDVGDAKYTVGDPVKDTTVPRLRRKIIVSEQTISGQSLAAARAKWEMARRIGRSQAVTATVDSWRDQAGTLWAPNVLVRLDLPAIKIVNVTWLIADVTYRKDEKGTHADLHLMPKEAFSPEPDPLQPFDYQLQQALTQGAGQ